MLDSVRLSVGTLSVLPVGHPTSVDRHTWGQAMALAPVVGLVLGGIAWACAFGVIEIGGSPLLGGVTAVAALACLTRGLHLDGLSDVADGLGSRRPPEQAREVMKRSDIGPFGVVTLVLVLVAQVAALESLLDASPIGNGAVALISATVISRTAIVLSCRRGVAAAAPRGLGAQAGEAVSPAAAASVALASIAAVSVATLAVDAEHAPAYVFSGLVALAVGEIWRRHCSRRFGGITGDILGSVEQLTFTTYLVSLVVLLL